LKEVVLVRYSEIAVKGSHTRQRMEKLLIENITEALKSKGTSGDIRRLEGRIVIENPKPNSLEVAKVVSKVFGVKSVSPAVLIEFSEERDLVDNSYKFFKEKVKGKLFAVRARRVGSHNFTSKDVERDLGKRLLEAGARGVNLSNPEYIAYIEIRGNKAYLYDTIIRGPGGLPLGSEDPVLLLFSGGFDSSVSAWLLMRRGSPISLITFYLGFKEPLVVAIEIANFLKKEWAFGSNPFLYIVDFSDIVKEVITEIKRDYRVLVLRRLMAEFSEHIAVREGFQALATGECIGQVASQTINNLRLIWEKVEIPVLRPVIGMDKDEIVDIARKIGIYDLASKQVEICGKIGTPNPRASKEVFESEINKIRKVLGESFKDRKYFKFSIGELKIEEILRKLDDRR
jgi:thiamine biosynthesis protein ThiI